MKNILKNSSILLISGISTTLTACHATGQNVRSKFPYDIMRETIDFLPTSNLPQLSLVNRTVAKAAIAKENEIYARYEAEFFPGGNSLGDADYYYNLLSEQFIDDNYAMAKIAMSVLLEHEASPINYVQHPNVLHDAVKFFRRTKIIGLLIENNVDVNRLDANGDTPLHIAATTYNRDKPDLLVESYSSDFYSISALIIATLLANGADVNAQDADGDTPLHLALRSCKNTLATALLTAPNINVNLRNTSNETPLRVLELNRYGYCYDTGVADYFNYPDLIKMIKEKGEVL